MSSLMIVLHFGLSKPPAKSSDMREPGTPSELAARRKSTKPQKIFKKNLSSVFEDARISKQSADSSPDTKVVIEESADSSAISEVEDGNENEFCASSVITMENIEQNNLSVSCDGLNTVEGIRTGSVELEIAVNFLKKSRLQVLNSFDVDAHSKKLVDFLTETAVDNLLNDNIERDQTTELFHAKIAIVLVFLFFWILSLVLFFGDFGGTSSFHGPVPT